MPQLTLKQSKFCDAYIGKAQGNATEAARIAGYKGSPETLRVIASENLTKPNITHEIKRLTDEASKRGALGSSQEVLERIWQIANGSGEDRDRLKALELLGKFYRLWNPIVEIDFDIEYEIKMDGIDAPPADLEIDEDDDE